MFFSAGDLAGQNPSDDLKKKENRVKRERAFKALSKS
jgi:hypothetical protein